MDINAQTLRDQFDENSVHLKDLMNKKNKRTNCIDVCVSDVYAFLVYYSLDVLNIYLGLKRRKTFFWIN